MKKPSKITPRYVGLEHAGRVEKLSREEIATALIVRPPRLTANATPSGCLSSGR